jgi:hypothetical protein
MVAAMSSLDLQYPEPEAEVTARFDEMRKLLQAPGRAKKARKKK